MFGGMRFRCMALFMQLYKSLHYEEKNTEIMNIVESFLQLSEILAFLKC